MRYPEELVLAIERAMLDQGVTLLRETDLEAIPQFLGTRRPAKLFVDIDDVEASIDVDVGLLKTGEFILPWRSDVITESLSDGASYLLLDGKKIFFNSMRELFFGEVKAFVAGAASSHE